MAARPAAEAIPVLLQRYGEKLFRLGVRECGSEDEARDLLQDTLISAYRNWGQFEGRSSPSTWLYTIAVRGCIRRHRRRAGEPAVVASLEELLPDPSAPMAVVPADDDPLSEAIRHEARDAVDQAISRLPFEYRLPLMLKEIAELSVQQVAEILDLKEATVKTRVHRGRLMLRRALDGAMPRESLDEPDHSRQMCLDLLRLKQETLDSGVDFPLPKGELCSRCQALFATLDYTHEVCVELGAGGLPNEVRQLLDQAARDAAERSRTLEVSG